MQFCECKQDGYCPRYRRQMRGRFREICRGINVDLGTAANFREQWKREAEALQLVQPVKPILDEIKPLSLVLGTNQAVGDALVMTAAIYSLHKAFPGRYTTAVDSQWPEVFEHNPDVHPIESLPGPFRVRLNMHYPAVHQCNKRAVHFMGGWCEHIGAALGIHVPLLTNHPHLYFYDSTPDLPNGDYWLICSGGKNDFTNKLWGWHNYQKVVDLLWGKIKFIQVGASLSEHTPLNSVGDLIGKTSLRNLFNLVRRARGVLCGVGFLMHVAAALSKPAVVVAGGREPVQWNAYPLQHYVHTVGVLPCRSLQGDRGVACWRGRVVPLGDSKELDENTCEYPVNGNPTSLTRYTLPKCMTLIRPATVADLVVMMDTPGITMED